MATAVQLAAEGPYPAPRRLVGALAAAVVIGNNASAFERVKVLGLGVLRVRAKFASVTGTVTLQIYPVLSDGRDDDTTGTRAATNLPTAATTTGTTEITQDYTCAGEAYVDVKVSLSNGGSDTGTVTYVELAAIP